MYGPNSFISAEPIRHALAADIELRPRQIGTVTIQSRSLDYPADRQVIHRESAAVTHSELGALTEAETSPL